jgi:hypothetical protein
VISVDTKKKELVGEYANGGKQWQPAGQPVEVKSHDFIDLELGQALPYRVHPIQGSLLASATMTRSFRNRISVATAVAT